MEFFLTLTVIMSILVPIVSAYLFHQKKLRYLAIKIGLLFMIIMLSIMLSDYDDMGSLMFIFYAMILGASVLVTFSVIVYKQIVYLRETESDEHI